MMLRWVRHPIFPYASPFFVYVLMLAAAPLNPLAIYWLYPAMVVGVGLLMICLWKRWPAFRISRPWASVILGLLGAVLWIGLYPWLGRTEPAPDAGFNPRLFENVGVQIALITFRLLGATLVVPIMEEVFWRGFLQRMLVREEFESVEWGTYTHLSFWGTTGIFVLAHADQWGVALLWGTLAGFWFIRTRTLGDVILLHAVTNLALGLYVLITGRWYFW